MNLFCYSSQYKGNGVDQRGEYAMKRIGWVILVAVLVLLGGCGGGSEEGLPIKLYESLESTDLSAEMGGLDQLDVTEEKVREAKGDPIMEGETNFGIVLDFEDYQYTFSGEQLQGYSIKKGTRTERGIGIGDPLERIVKAYGDRYLEREDGGRRFIGYADKEGGRIVEFVLREGRTETILVLLTGKLP